MTTPADNDDLVRRMLHRRADGWPPEWLLPSVTQAVQATRGMSLGGAAYLVGHFGSYGDHIALLLREVFKDLLSSDRRIAGLCTGSGSDLFVRDMIARYPNLRGRLVASGRASANDISVQLQACDVLIQPYPDGVTTRRTSVMAGLANGCAIATTLGKLTENVWQATGCVAMAPARDTAALAHVARELLADGAAREQLRRQSLAAYDTYFALRHTIHALRSECAEPSVLEPVF